MLGACLEPEKQGAAFPVDSHAHHVRLMTLMHLILPDPLSSVTSGGGGLRLMHVVVESLCPWPHHTSPSSHSALEEKWALPK